MTKGLPASGKSTWAKIVVDDNPGKYKRVSKDALRAMLDNNRWSGTNEKFVVALRNTIIVETLKKGISIIVDDTNLNPVHENALKELAKENGATFEIKDFTHVSVEECIKRDQQRQNYVGEKVIKSMYKQFLAPAPVEAPKIDPKLRVAIICDIDGTIAHMKNRGPFEWDKVDTDEPDRTIVRILQREYRHMLLVSGRDESCREKTIQWLRSHEIPFDQLWMRPAGDMRKDVIIKQEIYENHIKGKYNVEFVLDDRNQVVEFWRSQGLKCLQVAEGDF